MRKRSPRTSLSVHDDFSLSKSTLVSYSPNDRPWDEHRAQTDQVESVFSGSFAVHHRAWSKRLGECSAVLGFGWESNCETGECRLRLRTAGFCRVRVCPVCQWRRSMKHKARLLERLPKVQAEYAGRWLFLTLTVRNCPVDQLRETIKALTGGFTRLRRASEFPAVGWIRTVEVTRGRDGSAHPHLHCLLLVKPSYFGGKRYLSTREWVRLWRRCAKLDYDPVVDVRAVKPNPRRSADRLESVAAEVAKYSMKPSDMVRDDSWLRVYADQVHRLRFVDSGGVLRGILADDYDDLVHVDDEAGPADDESGDVDLRFGWDRSTRHYRKQG